MAPRVLILGAGFGGLEAATSLREKLGDECEITLVDQKDYFSVGFAALDVLFGEKSSGQVKYGYSALESRGVNFINERVEAVDPDRGHVVVGSRTLEYDYLIVALGAELAPEQTQGFTDVGHHFYSLEAAADLHSRLRDFDRGTVTLAVLGVPYKCPPAPFEAVLRLHDFFRDRGVLEGVSLQIMIPGASPLPMSPVASDYIEEQLDRRGIGLLREHSVGGVDADSGAVLTEAGHYVNTDLLIGVPVHRAPRVIRESPLGARGWIHVDPGNLRTEYPNVYAVGDCVHVPAGAGAVPKAGTFAEDAARTVVSDIEARERGAALARPFEAQGECFIEVGDGQVAIMRANMLGGSTPSVSMSEPSLEHAAEKERFVEQRVERRLAG